MNKSQKCASIIVKILLMFSIMLAVLTIFINYFLLNKNTYINMLNKEGTYAKVTESIYSKIDSVLKDKNINYDIKESLITEDDVKKEADTAITGLTEYLKTGENNMTPIDTTVYKRRVSDILKSFVNGDNLLSENTSQDEKGNLASNESVTNNQLQSKNLSYTEGQLEFQNLKQVQNKVVPENMMYVQNVSNNGSNKIVVEKVASRSEIENQIRSKLAEKGITEDQARQMLKDKGISEDQALKMYEQNGMASDDNGKSEQSSDSQQKESSDNKANSDQSNISSKEATSNDDKSKADNNAKVSSNDKLEDKLNVISDDKKAIIQNQLNDMVNKLVDEAGSTIDKEVEKINLQSLTNSNKIQKIAQITSIFYKMKWVFIMIPIALAIILGILERNIISTVKWIGIGFILTGVFLLAISVGGNVLKVYEKINISTVYLKDIICNTVKHFLMILSTSGIITFVIGVVLLIPTVKVHSKKHLNR